MRLDPEHIYSARQRQNLRYLSLVIHNEDRFKERMRDLFAKHQELWEESQKDPGQLATAKERTDSELDKEMPHGPVATTGKCPVCSQKAVIFLEVDGEYQDGEAVTTGVFATGLTCFFCELRVEGPEAADYLEINQQIWE